MYRLNVSFLALARVEKDWRELLPSLLKKGETKDIKSNQ